MQVQPIEALFFRDFTNAHIPEIFEEIYLKDIYRPFLAGKKDLVVVDVGANIGLFSYFAKNYAKIIYALEPAKEHVEVLQKLIAFNKIKNITICPYALSNKNGKTVFYHNPNTTAHSLSEVMKNPDNEEVETVDFDEFMKRNKLTHIDLLKLDPEGEEGKIIASDAFAKWAPNIQTIVGEWHAWSNMEIPQFTTTLTDLGYQVNWLPNLKAQVYTAVRV